MRHCKTLQLEDDRTVTVRELTVADARRLFAKFNDLSGVTLKDLFVDRFTEIAQLAAPMLQFSPEGALDDLTGSELKQVIDAALEVNQAFLGLAGLAPALAILSSSSTPAVADSSSEDTLTSSTTAGASS